MLLFRTFTLAKCMDTKTLVPFMREDARESGDPLKTDPEARLIPPAENGTDCCGCCTLL